MARCRFIYDRAAGKVVEVSTDWRPPARAVAPLIIGDIRPYRCVVDGEMITSRRRHREKLRETGCIEGGSEPVSSYRKSPTPLPAVEPDIKRAIEQANSGNVPRIGRARGGDVRPTT